MGKKFGYTTEVTMELKINSRFQIFLDKNGNKQIKIL